MRRPSASSRRFASPLESDPTRDFQQGGEFQRVRYGERVGAPVQVLEERDDPRDRLGGPRTDPVRHIEKRVFAAGRPLEFDRSAVRREQSREAFEQGRLAGAVRSDQTEQFLFADRETHVAIKRRSRRNAWKSHLPRGASIWTRTSRLRHRTDGPGKATAL